MKLNETSALLLLLVMFVGYVMFAYSEKDLNACKKSTVIGSVKSMLCDENDELLIPVKKSDWSLVKFE